MLPEQQADLGGEKADQRRLMLIERALRGGLVANESLEPGSPGFAMLAVWQGGVMARGRCSGSGSGACLFRTLSMRVPWSSSQGQTISFFVMLPLCLLALIYPGVVEGGEK